MRRYFILLVPLLVLLTAVPSWATLSVGVHAQKSNTAGATAVTTGVTTQTTGSGIFLGVVYDTTFVSVVDSNLNTWVQIGTEQSSNGILTRIYYCANCSGGATHTFTLTVTGVDSCGIWMVEVKTTNGAGITLDQQNQNTDATSPYTSPGLTTTIADEILAVFTALPGPSGTYNFTAGNSFALQDQDNDGANDYAGASGTRIVSATGTYNSSWTISSAPTTTLNRIASFSEAAGGGGPDVTPFYKRRAQ